MYCIKQNAEQLYRVRRGNDQPFTLVVRRSPEGYELGEGKGEQLSPEELEGLRVTIYEPNFGEGFEPDIRTFGDAIGFELSRVQTERYGLGIYEVEVSFTVDGEGEKTLRAPLCLVVKEDAHVTAQNHQLILDLAPIAKGERGDRGQSAYEAYLDNTDDNPKMSEAEWIRSLKSVDQRMREAKGYTDARVNDLSNSVANAREAIRTGLRREADRGDADTLKGAKNYADGKTAEAKRYTDEKAEEAKRRADEKAEEAKRHADEAVKRAREETHQEIGIVRELAYRKSRRFLAALPPAEYKEGDEWVLPADWTTYKRGTVLIAVKDSRAGIYSPEDWAELHKYVQLIEEAKRWNVHTHTFDLTQLDPSKYYAAVIHLTGSKGIPYKQPAYFEISLYAGLDPSVPKPPYATHPDGFGVDLRWSVNASGYGGRSEDRLVSGYSKVWVAQGEEVVSAPRQLTAMSAEYVYLRGGGRYIAEVKSDYKPTFALATENWALKGYERHVIPSPVDSIMPPKSDVERLRDDMREGDKATLEGAKNAATTKANEAIGTIQLGGRNYLRAKWSLERQQDGRFYDVSFGYELPAGTYTLSGEMEVKRKGSGLMLIPKPYESYFRDHPSERARIDWPEGGGRFTLTVTTKVPLDGFYLYPNREWVDTGQGGHVVFRRLKLELGNKSSDWSPAPEDVDTAIAALEERIAALEAKTSGG